MPPINLLGNFNLHKYKIYQLSLLVYALLQYYMDNRALLKDQLRPYIRKVTIRVNIYCDDKAQFFMRVKSSTDPIFRMLSIWQCIIILDSIND